MRVVAISDLHGTFPHVPECDLLVVAGDVCPDIFGGGIRARHAPHLQRHWFDTTFLPWASAKAREVLVTWGNHDFCGLADGQGVMRSQAFPNVRTIVDAEVQACGLFVWCSPWSRPFKNWAFMCDDDQLAETYGLIDEGIDLLVSHGPPFGAGDGAGLGSTALREAVERVQPRAVVCGHVHEGAGRHHIGRTPVYNVAVLDEHYRYANVATVIEL